MPQDELNSVLVYQNSSMELIEKLTDCTWHNNWKLEDVKEIVNKLRDPMTGLDVDFLDTIVAIFKTYSSIDVNKKCNGFSPYRMQSPRQLGDRRILVSEVLETL